MLPAFAAEHVYNADTVYYQYHKTAYLPCLGERRGRALLVQLYQAGGAAVASWQRGYAAAAFVPAMLEGYVLPLIGD